MRGYSIDDEEKKKALGAWAAVRAHSGVPVAAMSISGPAFRMTKERIPEVGQALTQAASDLSAELGYHAAPLELIRSASG